MSSGKMKRMRKAFESQKERNQTAPPGIHDFILVLDHLNPDFNIGKLFRSADAFGCREIHLVGIPFFDPEPAMGSFKHVSARFFDSLQLCLEQIRKQGYALFALDPEKGGFLNETDLPRRSAFILGREGSGLSFGPEDFKNVSFLKIPQFGKAQSLNVSIAGSIVMYEWVRRHADLSKTKGPSSDRFFPKKPL